MKKVIAIAVLVLSCVAVAQMSFAATDTDKKSEKTPGVEKLSGKIVSIDKAKNEITIEQTDKKNQTFVVDADTLSSLKVGDKVHISHKEGSNKAQSVRVSHGEKMKSKKKS